MTDSSLDLVRPLSIALALLMAPTACDESDKTAAASETKAAETKVAKPKAAETKAAETKAAETKAAETKAAETKTVETKTAETKAAETKTAETKTAETKTAETKTAETKTAETKTADASSLPDPMAEYDKETRRRYEKILGVNLTGAPKAVAKRMAKANSRRSKGSVVFEHTEGSTLGFVVRIDETLEAPSQYYTLVVRSAKGTRAFMLSALESAGYGGGAVDLEIPKVVRPSAGNGLILTMTLSQLEQESWDMMCARDEKLVLCRDGTSAPECAIVTTASHRYGGTEGRHEEEQINCEKQAPGGESTGFRLSAALDGRDLVLALRTERSGELPIADREEPPLDGHQSLDTLFSSHALGVMPPSSAF